MASYNLRFFKTNDYNRLQCTGILARYPQCPRGKNARRIPYLRESTDHNPVVPDSLLGLPLNQTQQIVHSLINTLPVKHKLRVDFARIESPLTFG
jgi:hypothetical protein